MGVISYNSDEMEAVATDYRNSLDEVHEIKSNMASAVARIRENWQGDDAMAAEGDLKAIETQIASIERNLEEILSLITKVSADFGQLSYKKGDDSNG